MNIGDKVRFLNSVGGGTISAFDGKDIVVVRDEDGFDIPTLRSEIVVIETDNYNLVRKSVAQTTPKPAVTAPVEEHEVDLADQEMTFHARPLERRGGEKLNAFLGFLPIDLKTVTETAFESYFINDSNYYIRFCILSQEGKAYHLRYEGVAEPNTKCFVEEFDRSILPEMERMTVQLFAYKTDKSFGLKPAMTVELRLDLTKFYKLHTFQPSEFFNEPSLIIDIVRDDRPVRAIMIEPEALKQQMLAPNHEDRSPQPARKGPAKLDRNAIIEVDLHAEQLLETTAGMDAKAILEYQTKVVRETLDAHLKERGRRIVFIHGKGDGVLRQSIIGLLKRQYRQCTHQDASFREYGYGATMVTVR